MVARTPVGKAAGTGLCGLELPPRHLQTNREEYSVQRASFQRAGVGLPRMQGPGKRPSGKTVAVAMRATERGVAPSGKRLCSGNFQAVGGVVLLAVVVAVGTNIAFCGSQEFAAVTPMPHPDSELVPERIGATLISNASTKCNCTQQPIVASHPETASRSGSKSVEGSQSSAPSGEVTASQTGAASEAEHVPELVAPPEEDAAHWLVERPPCSERKSEGPDGGEHCLEPTECLGKCLYVHDHERGTPVTSFRNTEFARSRFTGVGMTLVDRIPQADVVLFMDGMSLAELTDVSEIAERLKPWQRGIHIGTPATGTAGGFVHKDSFQTAMRELLRTVRKVPVIEGVDRWKTETGVELDFDPNAKNSIIPASWLFRSDEDRARLLEETRVPALLPESPDANVDECSESFLSNHSNTKSSVPIILKNGAAHASAGNIIVWSVQGLRKLRCDVVLANKMIAGEDVPTDAWHLIPVPSKTSFAGHKLELLSWVAQRYVNTLLVHYLNPLTEQHDWRRFHFRAFAVVLSSRQPTVAFHHGFVYPATEDARDGDLSGPRSKTLTNLKAKYSDEQKALLTKLGQVMPNLPFADLEELVRGSFPDHPDAAASLRCSSKCKRIRAGCCNLCLTLRCLCCLFAPVQQAASLAFSSKLGSVFNVTNERDNGWYYAFDFIVGRDGNVWCAYWRLPRMVSNLSMSLTPASRPGTMKFPLRSSQCLR